MTIRNSYPLALLATFVLTLGLVAAFNYRIDPAHLFDEGKYAESAARLMAGGSDVLAANLDERLLQKHYAAKMSRAPAVLVLGSSRIMEIDSGMVTDGPLYNTGLSTATLPDLLALTELFVARREKRPRTVIIGIDPWTFEATPRNRRWHTLATEYRAMLGRLGNWEAFPAPRRGFEGVLELISVAYLQRAMKSFKWNFPMLLKPRLAQATPVTQPQETQAVRRADGSLVYAANSGAQSEQDIRAAALAQAAKQVTGILRADPLDGNAIGQFEALVKWLIGQEIRVILLLPPFHPAHFDYVQARDRTGSLGKIETMLNEMARRQGAELIGGSNPRQVGCVAAEFRDGVHARPACLRRILKEIR